MANKRSNSLSALGQELGMFLLICISGFAMMRLVQHFWDDALTMLVGSSAIVAFMLLVKRDLATTVAGLLMGVIGPLAEMRAVGAGALAYPNPHIEGLPAWTFLVWGATGIFVASFYEFLRVLIAQAEPPDIDGN